MHLKEIGYEDKNWGGTDCDGSLVLKLLFTG